MAVVDKLIEALDEHGRLLALFAQAVKAIDARIAAAELAVSRIQIDLAAVSEGTKAQTGELAIDLESLEQRLTTVHSQALRALNTSTGRNDHT